MRYTVPGLVLTDHELQVPLDHARPDDEQITIFAREVAEPEGREKPFLVFLQGGPGFEANRPTGSPRAPGWIDRALKEFRVLLLDQRGTGRSTPVNGLESAEYLQHFRAGSIVRDAERLRQALGVERWSDAEDVRLPTGDRLTARRLRTHGNRLGMSDGPETLHYILELAPDSLAFLHDVSDALGIARNPIYALLHEAGWADGGATNWSADRMRPAIFDERTELLTGEHIFPWVFEDYGARVAAAV